MSGKTITVERDVEEDESIAEAIYNLLSDIDPLTRLDMKGRASLREASESPEKRSTKWTYRTQQPSAKFAERYARLVEGEEE